MCLSQCGPFVDALGESCTTYIVYMRRVKQCTTRLLL